MSSLSDTYENGPLGAVWDKRKLLVAIGLFVSGVLFFLTSILAGTTEVFTGLFNISTTQSWEIAGVFGGIALPFLIVGVFTIMPASHRQRAGAAVGLAIALVGVFLFYNAFPHQWHGDPTDHTFRVLATYFLGTITTIVYLFISIANFRQRNDPGGNVTLHLDIEGSKQSVSVSREQLTDEQEKQLQQQRETTRLSRDD